MTYEQQMQHFECMVSAAADDSFKQLMIAPLTQIFIWCIPSSDVSWGRLIASTDQPDGADLACSTPVPASFTRDQVRHWIRVRSTRLPLFPTGDTND